MKNSLAGFEDSMDSVDFEDEIPDDLHNTCYLEKDYFDETGFTNIGLTSVRELIVDNGVHFSPSMMKMPDPFPNSAQQEMSFKNFTGFGTHIKNGLVQVSPDYITSSSVLLAAGKNMKFTGTKDAIPTVFFASQETFFLPESALISVPSEGSISIDAPGIELSGQLQALSGDVQLSASINDIMLNPGSKILAGGYNRPQTSVPANNLRTNFTPVDGGSVYLKSKLGSIDVEQGALIDVSGSTPVVNQYKGADRTIYTGTVAGDSGSVSFSYHDDLELSGNLNAGHHMEGLMGGSLTIGRTDTEEALSIAPGEIDSFIDSGFDAFTFSSYSDLVFQPGEEDLLIQAGRRLTLDAPEIIAGNNWNIHLKAPWIQLSNTYDKYDLQSLGSGFDPGVLIPDAVESGESILTLQGDFIDVAGSLGLSGFKNVSLEAGKDIRFDEEDYNKFWEGKLLAPGDLSFTASRIYPTTDSRFTIQSNGKVTTSSNGEASADTIYSAGGSLKIEAQDIEHNGFLAAPLGEIVLETKDNGRIFLGEGSVISTRGALPVKYGTQGKLFWTKTDKDNPKGDPIVVETGLEGAVTIKASANNGEIIMKKGAEINVSGGGAISSYLFQPGVEGTKNPLDKDGTYVIVPGIQSPGPAVYLDGEGGLSGRYSLLPGEFAFLPGA
ncbi:MAG: hypothetical protein KAS86_05640, partial [Candidatus Omnitrophica bacterium]|nr:hypothetical protein [Candidatus Omnitrophota bacterium]